MLTHLILSVVSLSWSVAAGQATQDQQPRVEREARQNREREDSPEDREARRARRRERWERYRNATPEERRQVRTDRMVNMATRAYELDETQKELVRTEIETMREERRVAMGPAAVEYDALRGQMFEFFQRRREQAQEEGDEEGDRGRFWRRMRDDPKFREIRERMREIEREHPFDWEQSMKRVEALLPEEQARKGRARLEERFSRFRQRRQRWEERRTRREERRANAVDIVRADPAGRDALLKQALAEAQKKLADGSLSETERQALIKRLEEASRQDAKATPRPLHPWEKYVREYVKIHAFTPAQQAAAMSILKELRARAARIERINAPKIVEAEALENTTMRTKRLADLQKPIDKLFEELKARLDGLLNASQRQKPDKKVI